MGIWPGVGVATQVQMTGGHSPLKFSFADGGYADNYGIAGHLRHMSLTGNETVPSFIGLTIPSYKNFAQFLANGFVKSALRNVRGQRSQSMTMVLDLTICQT